MGVELQKSSLVRLFININYDYCYAIVITFYSCTRRYGTKALHAIFDVVPRIALGSIVAYIIGQHIDVFIFSLIKKYLVLIKRFSSVHMVFLSSIIDTALFVAIAFIGSLPGTVVFEIFITTYVLKLASTVFNVPFGYIAKSFYRKGKIDKLDQGY